MLAFGRKLATACIVAQCVICLALPTAGHCEEAGGRKIDITKDGLAMSKENRPLDGRFPEANDAVAGKVFVVGVPWTFAGNRIDWAFNATAVTGPFNNEWTWQLNRMYFWSALAAAYRETHDERYAEAFARQLTDWLDQTNDGTPPESEYNTPGSLFRTIEEGLRLFGSWPGAYEAFKDSPAFTESLKCRFVKSMRAQAKHLMTHRSGTGNWLLMEMTGAYNFAAMFSDYPESSQMRKTSARLFYEAMKGQMLPDGMQYELSSDYHHVLYMTAGRLLNVARKYGYDGELSKDYFALLEQAAEATLNMMSPGFASPAFNDSYSTPVHYILEPASQFFPEREDFLWGATKGEQGAAPVGETASRFMPYSGFAIMRTDWTPNASYLAFDVGPLGASGHRHQDKLSFTMWKGDEELVFEDGGGQYDNSPFRSYARSGYDHNILLVDGLVQKRDTPDTVSAPIDAKWSTTVTEDRATGIYDQGFGDNMDNLATHTRTIVFDKKADAFTITDDAVSADGNAHGYKIQFHVDATDVTVSGNKAIVRYGKKWNLELTVIEGGTISTASGQTSPRISGWFVGRKGVVPDVHKATTITVSAPVRAQNHRFVTVLHPFAAR